MDIIFLILGILIGSITGFLLARNLERGKYLLYKQRNDDFELQLLEKSKLLSEKESKIIELTSTLATRESELRSLQQRMLENKQELNELQERFRAEFKNLANDIFEEKSKRFTEQNKTNLDIILKPFNEKLKEFEKKVDETYDKEAQQRFSLKEEVKRLAELNQLVSKEANALTQALKGESKTQGNWGEMILESILEKTGLVRDREFKVQESFKNDDGNRVQPDVVVYYPGERSIVIDSKVSLVAYERFCSAESIEEKEVLLKDHIQSVKTHITGLSIKKYESLYELKSLDFVIMFMPIEPAYLIAMQADGQLWNYAYERRIILISPTNLIAALKMIESMWRMEYQNKNVMEIARQGAELYDDFVRFSEELIKLGLKLEDAQKSYKESMKHLVDGRGNLVKRVETLRELGIKNKKSIPQKLLDRAGAVNELEEINNKTE